MEEIITYKDFREKTYKTLSELFENKVHITEIHSKNNDEPIKIELQSSLGDEEADFLIRKFISPYYHCMHFQNHKINDFKFDLITDYALSVTGGYPVFP